MPHAEVDRQQLPEADGTEVEQLEEVVVAVDAHVDGGDDDAHAAELTEEQVLAGRKVP